MADKISTPDERLRDEIKGTIGLTQHSDKVQEGSVKHCKHSRAFAYKTKDRRCTHGGETTILCSPYIDCAPNMEKRKAANKLWDKVQGIGLVAAFYEKIGRNKDIFDKTCRVWYFTLEKLLIEQEARLQRDFMPRVQHNRIMSAIAGAQLKNFEGKGIYMYRDDVERDWMPKPDYEEAKESVFIQLGIFSPRKLKIEKEVEAKQILKALGITKGDK